LGGVGVHRAPRHFNPMIDLHIEHKPVFGLYAPSNPRGRRGGPPPADAPAPKSAAELAKQALAYPNSDYIFDGSMEGDFDRGYPQFEEFVKGWSAESKHIDMTGGAHLTQPLAVKTHEIAENIPLAQERIAKQLNLGVSTVVFPGVESADEVKAGLAAMRFKSKGGVRPDNVGDAPKYWGMSEAEYKQKADLWPLNPNGELTNWTIVESKEGLAHIREIAAVKGIGVLFPGAGTLRGVFSTMENGQRKFDEAGWENAIQQVLAACKEFNVPCGYPATERDVAERMKQGFSVFVINWGEPGFRTIDIGRKIAGR
jgi:4-hydroxy-2-oxoheptanedioate aldolase